MAICRITYDGGLAGSGKTFNKLKHINLKDATTVCSTVSLKLGDEHEKVLCNVMRADSVNESFGYELDTSVAYKYIGGELKTSIVNKKAAERLSEIVQFGEFDVVTTHNTLMKVLLSADCDANSFGLYIGDVDLFIDEEFKDVLRLFSIIFTNTTASLDEVADIGVWKDNPKGLDDNILEITAKNLELIELKIESSKNPQSDVSANMGAFLKFLKNDRYIKLISRKSLTEAKERLCRKGEAKFTFAAIFDVNLLMQFNSVHISVADFPNTETALIFDYLNVNVREDLYRSKEYPVNEGQHDNSNLIINYYSDEDWSQKLRDHKVKSGSSNKVKVAEHIREAVGGSELIWNANQVDRMYPEDVLCEIFEESNAELVTDVAGVNSYDNVNNAAYMASAKFKTEERYCLKNIGINPEKVESARTHLRAYQFLMRSSIRNKDADLSQIVNWYVMDKSTAMYIKKLFPNAEMNPCDVALCSVHSINEGGRPKGVSEDMKLKYFKAKRLRSEKKMTKKDACKAVGMSTQYYGTCKKQLN